MSTQRRVGAPREAILETATHLFGEKGYAGTTMRDIAKAVGVLPGSLYSHIEAKETVLFEIVEGGIDRFIAAGESVSDIADPANRMRAAIKAHLAVVAESPERTHVVFHEWRFLSGISRACVVEKRQRYEGIFANILDEGVTSGAFGSKLDTKIGVHAILGALNWTAEWYSPSDAATAGDIGDRIADTVLWGLLRSAV